MQNRTVFVLLELDTACTLGSLRDKKFWKTSLPGLNVKQVQANVSKKVKKKTKKKAKKR